MQHQPRFQAFPKMQERGNALELAGNFCNFNGLLPHVVNLFKTVYPYIFVEKKIASEINAFLQLFADECVARRIFNEVLLSQSNVETGQTQRWAGSNPTFANAQN